ncbi:MAG: nitronate monooxygenase [Candidatus Berkelbacteria bacterium]|nr:nitronate monooxygenase [Candidatus Berkelbacteria bacterium]
MNPVSLFGHDLQSPIVIASGTLGYEVDAKLAKQAVVILKSLKEMNTPGNQQPRITEVIKSDILEIDKSYSISDLADTPGMVNCIGLQNPGVDGFIERYASRYQSLGGHFIASVAGNAVPEYSYVVSVLSAYSKLFLGLEINISCPNVKEGLVFGTDPKMTYGLIITLRQLTKMPLIVKLTPNVPDICEIAKAAVDAGADALSLINTIKVKAQMRDGRTIEGGLSGPMIFPIACRLVEQVCKKFPDIPVIAGGGVWCVEDVQTMLDLGATLVSVGTLNFTSPVAVLNLIREYKKKG